MVRRIGTLLLLLTFVAAPPAANAGAPPDVEAKTVAFIRDLVKAPSASAWIASHPAAVDRAVADTAAELSDRAAMDGRMLDAIVAAQLAYVVYVSLGQKALAVASMLKVQQARFMIAETPEQYGKVAADSAALAEEAKRLSRADLQFKFHVTAADATLFAADAQRSAGDAILDPMLLTTLQRATIAFTEWPKTVDRLWIEKLVSLTAATVGEAMSRVGSNELDAAFKRLAPLVEKQVPVDFEYGGQGTSAKTIEHAIHLANLSYRYGQAAVGNGRLAVAEKRANASGDLRDLARVLWHRYRGELRANPRSTALTQLRQKGVEAVDRLRATYRSRAGRLWAAYEADVLLGEMANGELERSSTDAASAFAWIDGAKSRMLLDDLSGGSGPEVATPEARRLERTVLGFSPTSKEEDDDLVMTELRLESQLSGFSTTGESADRVAALSALEAMYRDGTGGFFKVAKTATLEQIQQALQPGEVVVEYLEPYSELGPRPNLWILQISHDRTALVNAALPKASFIGRMVIDGKSPIDAGGLGDLVVGARTAIRTADQSRAKSSLRQLYGLLVQPLVDKGLKIEDVKRLIVIPHGPLHQVPFPALLDEKDRYLISRTEVVTAPSASIWRILQARANASSRWAAFVDPKSSDPKLPRLEFAAQEGHHIATSFPAGMGKIFEGPKATWSNLSKVAPTAGYLHFATHGEFPGTDALDLHALLVAPEKGRSPLLRAAEVRRLNLHATRLVSLSVCNAGLYRIGPANEPYGLMPAFLEAGAQNVLGTLWPVDDQFGRDFMIEFYKHLAADGPAGAYRKATMRFIDDGEVLRRWAGFVFVGPGRTAAP